MPLPPAGRRRRGPGPAVAVRRPKLKLRRILWPICFTTTFPCRSRLPKCPTEGCITELRRFILWPRFFPYGRPGKPGIVEVAYLSGLQLGHTIEVEVGHPGKGGAGGPAIESPVQGGPQFVDRGGAGGGRECSHSGCSQRTRRTATEKEPLCSWNRGSTKLSGLTTRLPRTPSSRRRRWGRCR